MNRVLVAVEDKRTSKAVISTFNNSVSNVKEVIIVHVERLAGTSLIRDMLGDAELATLKESMIGTDYKQSLDEKAETIIDYYRNELAKLGSHRITSIIRAGHPAEEILKVADDANVDLILLGYKGVSGFNRLFTGCVASDLQKKSEVPVIVAKSPITCEEPYSWKDAYNAIAVTSVIVIAMVLIGAIL